ncbi:MAG: isoleucine--tRNA ligase [bacterium]
MDYKETLNLPKTNFPMKANLTQKEPEMLEFWDRINLYQKMNASREGKPSFILHDGPPYANGDIHQGHALNKILKDIIVKFKVMQGHYSPYIPGWDCHGLPIELKVVTSPGKTQITKELTKLEIRKQCREYAKRYVDIQREEFKRLGVLGDWDNPYLTMNYEYEAAIVKEFGEFVECGLVYKGTKPVHWCTSCETALAEAEVEYLDHHSPSVFVKFRLSSEGLQHLGVPTDKPAFVAIWTTTPWTLPANLAVALHPDLEYAVVDTGKDFLILAKELVARCMDKFGSTNYKILKEFKGKDLESFKVRHPFIERDSLIITAPFVTLEQGTGCVHIAPGHGQDDYECGLKYDLEIYTPVDKHGCFTDEVRYFAGMQVFKANKEIVAKLKEENVLLAEEGITHSYPHCWRCKNPIIFRATEQWFISMDKKDLRKDSLKAINEVTWVPKWGRERIYNMVENRPDWCISRQRSWGVPIVAFYCKSCKQTILDKRLIDYVADLIRKEGADVWFAKDMAELLPPNTRCPYCQGQDLEREMDILDVWFDSGVSFAAVLEERKELSWPADLYLEGSDQHRGWFHSSLLASIGTRGRAPYKAVLTHGFVVDGEGKKMSKSLGNVIAPQEIIDKYGAEILRLWVSAEDYTDDIRISNDILSRLTEAYRRIRNTCRYMLGNLYDFAPKTHKVDYEKMFEIDKWALHQLYNLTKRIKGAYDTYNFHIVFHSLQNFCTVEMSSFYLDILKDRLYTAKADSLARRSAQTALFEILVGMTKLMAPILSFTSEEVWLNLANGNAPVESIFLSYIPEEDQRWLNNELASRWERIYQIRGEVSRTLEVARKQKVIGHSLDAKVTLYLPAEELKLLSDYAQDLSSIFIVSAVDLKNNQDVKSDLVYTSELIKGLSVYVEKSPGIKCARCWIYSESVGQDHNHPDICGRCVDTLNE